MCYRGTQDDVKAIPKCLILGNDRKLPNPKRRWVCVLRYTIHIGAGYPATDYNGFLYLYILYVYPETCSLLHIIFYKTERMFKMGRKKYCVMLSEDRNGNTFVEHVTHEKYRDEMLKLVSMKTAHNPNNYKYTIIDVNDAEMFVNIPIKTDGTLYWTCYANNGVVYRAQQMSYDEIAEAATLNKTMYPYIAVNCKTKTTDVISICMVQGKTETEAIRYCQRMVDKIMREREE